MPEGGQEEGSEERGRWEKRRSNELVPGPRRAEGKHVDERAGEFRPTDQRVTLQKKSTAGIWSDRHMWRSGCRSSSEQAKQHEWRPCTSNKRYATRPDRDGWGRRVLYSHMACFMSSPSLAWMKCSLYFGKTRARLQENSPDHDGWGTKWRLSSQLFKAHL